jgi:hypothetical protein
VDEIFQFLRMKRYMELEKNVLGEGRGAPGHLLRGKEHTGPELVSIVLSAEQARRLNPVIDKHRTATKVTGLPGAITRSYDAPAGAIVLQLQLLPLNRRIAGLLNRAAKQANAPHQVK